MSNPAASPSPVIFQKRKARQQLSCKPLFLSGPRFFLQPLSPIPLYLQMLQGRVSLPPVCPGLSTMADLSSTQRRPEDPAHASLSLSPRLGCLQPCTDTVTPHTASAALIHAVCSAIHTTTLITKQGSFYTRWLKRAALAQSEVFASTSSHQKTLCISAIGVWELEALLPSEDTPEKPGIKTAWVHQPVYESRLAQLGAQTVPRPGRAESIPFGCQIRETIWRKRKEKKQKQPH